MTVPRLKCSDPNLNCRDNNVYIRFVTQAMSQLSRDNSLLIGPGGPEAEFRTSGFDRGMGLASSGKN